MVINNKILLKITYYDNFSGDWWVEYDSADKDNYKKTLPRTNDNDNKWKTVTFTINDAGMNNNQKEGMDFRIYNGGYYDINVRFVRVIKQNKPGEE